MNVLKNLKRAFQLRALPKNVFSKLDYIISNLHSINSALTESRVGLVDSCPEDLAALSQRMDHAQSLLLQVADFQDDLVHHAIDGRTVAAKVAELEANIYRLGSDMRGQTSSILDGFRDVNEVTERVAQVVEESHGLLKAQATFELKIDRLSSKSGEQPTSMLDGLRDVSEAIKSIPQAVKNSRELLTVRPYDAERALAFLHIPKSAGASLKTGLARALEPKKCVYGFDRVLFGDFDDFESHDEANRRQIYLSPADVPSGADYIAGHFSLTTLRSTYPNAQLLTAFREPVSRVLSNWLYWRTVNDERRAQVGSWGNVVAISHGSLSSFLTNAQTVPNVDNVATRMLLWPHPAIPLSAPIPNSADKMLLEAAMMSLSNFSYIGLIEDPEFEIRLSAWLGRNVEHRQENITEGVPEHLREPLHRHLTVPAFHSLRNLTRLDYQLWCVIAQQIMPNIPLDVVRDQSIARTIARHALVMQ